MEKRKAKRMAESESDESTPVDKKSSWTSLEVSKLVMAALTPVALFALGYVVNKQNIDEQIKREEAVRADTKAQEQEKQAAAHARAVELAATNADRERLLKQEADRREDNLREDAFRRESDIRAQAITRERYQRLAQKRMEFWDRLSTKMAQMDRLLNELVSRGRWTAEEIRTAEIRIEELRRDCSDLFIIFRPYFSGRVEASFNEYSAMLRRLIGFLRAQGEFSPHLQEYASNSLRRAYELVLQLGAAEVASLSGIPTDSRTGRQ